MVGFRACPGTWSAISLIPEATRGAEASVVDHREELRLVVEAKNFIIRDLGQKLDELQARDWDEPIAKTSSLFGLHRYLETCVSCP